MAAFMQITKTKIYNVCCSGYVHDYKYKRILWFTEENVKWIVQNVHLVNDELETRGGALSTKQWLEAFLRYAAGQGFQVGVGEDLH